MLTEISSVGGVDGGDGKTNSITKNTVQNPLADAR